MNPLESAARNQEAWSMERERYRSVTGAEHLRSRPSRHIRITRMGRAVTPWAVAIGLVVLSCLAVYGVGSAIDRALERRTVEVARP